MLTSRRLLSVLAGVLTALILASPSGAACPPGGVCPPGDLDCTIYGCTPGTPPGGGGGGGGGGSNGCSWQGQTMPCSDPDLGSYIGNGCYVKDSSVQPGPPLGGGSPTGRWYVRSCFTAPNSGYYTQILAWYDNPPAGAGGPTPEELARQALAKITLKGAAIGIAPDPGGAGLVGLPVWMWTEVTPNTWGPITASASAGGITVSITGKATSITWSMGDGHSVTCTSPGTPFQAGRGGQASPDCGHVYQQASRNQSGGKYAITATTAWRVDWSGGGQTGVINVTRTSQTTVRIDELQVVTQ